MEILAEHQLLEALALLVRVMLAETHGINQETTLAVVVVVLALLVEMLHPHLLWLVAVLALLQISLAQP